MKILFKIEINNIYKGKEKKVTTFTRKHLKAFKILIKI
jgi:hypothetical protein